MRLLPRSLPQRVTVVVLLVFFTLSTVAAVVLVSWFRGHLEQQVRDDQAELLDRQAQVIDDLGGILEALPPEVAEIAVQPDEVRDLFNTGAIAIPPTGAVLRIIDADTGETLGSSTDAFRALMTQFDAQAAMAQFLEVERFVDELRLFIDQADPALQPDAFALVREIEVFLLGEEEMSPEELSATVEANEVLLRSLFGALAETTFEDGEKVIRSERRKTLGPYNLLLITEESAQPVDDAVSPVRKTMWFLVPLLTLLVGLIAWITTRRSLRPVAAITRQVDRLSPDDLGHRVPVPDSGDEIAHLATTMNTMLGRLQEAQTTQRRFVADASHELRTPIATIAAEIEVAQAIGDANDWNRTAEVVDGEQKRLSSLVDDLLFLARMSENPRGSRHELDLDDIVRGHAQRTWPVEVSAARVQPVRMEGEPRQLDRLVQNALANATRHARKRVEIGLERTNGVATLTVDDDGDGIGSDDRERVFERFTRLEEARHRDAGGAGLGLAMVREVAEAHGGSASLEASPLGGARLRATFDLG